MSHRSAVAMVHKTTPSAFVVTGDCGWHFTYHVDGKMYFKENKGDQLNDAQTTTEIAAVKEIKPLTSSGFPIHSMGRIANAFKGNPRAIHMFLVEQGDFSSYTHLGISHVLIHNSFEDQFIELMAVFDSQLSDHPPVIGFLTLPLAYFKDHKVAPNNLN
jgi:hypothetical protein